MESVESVLIYPGSELVYRVDTRNKRLTLQNPELLNKSKDDRSLHARTTKVFTMIGFKVVEMHDA